MNGEFGLVPGGATLSPPDSAGVHIHNTIRASTFSGAMGSAMTWWWDSYIAPELIPRQYTNSYAAHTSQLPASGLYLVRV